MQPPAPVTRMVLPVFVVPSKGAFTKSSACYGIAGAHSRELHRQISMLLVRDGQEDAIIYGNRTCEKTGGICAYDGDAPGIAAQSGPGGLCDGCCPVTGLKRNSGRPGRGGRRPQTSIPDEHPALAPDVAARGPLHLSRQPTRGTGGRG